MGWPWIIDGVTADDSDILVDDMWSSEGETANSPNDSVSALISEGKGEDLGAEVESSGAAAAAATTVGDGEGRARGV